MDPRVQNYLASIGRRGGKKSRRALDPKTARDMVRVREARRAVERFRTRCFWFVDPNYAITIKDVAWVAEQLQKHGGREGWMLGSKLCR